MRQPFDTMAQSYDKWYHTARGRQLFDAEVKCLKRVCPMCRGRWLEVGVGTGRFACRMGIAEGVDPSPTMLELAALRGLKTYVGFAEELAFETNTFDGILMAFTLCFVGAPQRAFDQSFEVLKANGRLLIGVIPAGSAWAKAYQQKKEQGHPIYSHAHFLSIAHIMTMAEQAGFELIDSAGTLICGPDELSQTMLTVEPKISEEAGFVALLLSKVQTKA